MHKFFQCTIRANVYEEELRRRDEKNRSLTADLLDCKIALNSLSVTCLTCEDLKVSKYHFAREVCLTDP